MAQEKIEKIVEAPFGADPRVYELGLLLIPTITEENLPVEVGNIKTIIDRLHAVTIFEEYPKKIPLAYEMEKVINNRHEKFTEGYFGWVKFEIAPTEIALLESTLKRDDRVIRFLITKTVRENTQAGRRINPRSDNRRRSSAKKEEGAPAMDTEAVDKKIDELLLEEDNGVKV